MRGFIRERFGKTNGIFIPIATKLIFAFILIIVFISAIFMVVGVRIISDRFVSEAQDKVRNDLNAAREIYQELLSADSPHQVRAAALHNLLITEPNHD